MLSLRDAGGIAVAPVTGTPAPVGAALAEAVAGSLRDAGTPAETGSGNRASFHLSGAATPGQIAWHLTGPDGADAGSHVQRLAAEPSPASVGPIAAEAARAIAGIVQEETPMVEDGSDFRVVVQPVEGAPGDGDAALSRAMTAALQQAQVRLAGEGQAKNAYVVAGKVAVERPAAKKQHVRIVWEVRRPSGETVGQVNQENDVPAGTLDGPWGDVAYIVATAASDGIVALLDKLKAGAAPS
jgi:hypothetical protein